MSTKRRVMVMRKNGRELEAAFHQFIVMPANPHRASGVYAVFEFPNGEVGDAHICRIRFLDSEVPHEQAR